jgi:hypothetical protein
MIQKRRAHRYRVADARDAALLVVGCETALRADGLHRLDLGDTTAIDDGLLVYLHRSETRSALAPLSPLPLP